MIEHEQILEKRMANRMVNYWELIKGDKVAPVIHEFNSDSISDIWPKCMKISIHTSREKKIYKYEYVGSEVKKAYGKDLTGQLVVPEIKNIPGAQIVRHIDECVENLTTKIDHGRFINDADKVIRYRSCILPFGKGGEKATHIIICLSWKAFNNGLDWKLLQQQ